MLLKGNAMCSFISLKRISTDIVYLLGHSPRRALRPIGVNIFLLLTGAV